MSRDGRSSNDTLLILLNAHHEPLAFTLPAHKRRVRWQPILDTTVGAGSEKSVSTFKGGERFELEARSITILRISDKQ